MKKLICKTLQRLQPNTNMPLLAANVLTVRSLKHLQIAMGWACEPILHDEQLRTFNSLCDLNERKLRDAEVIGSSCCNGDPKILLEIGTALGRTTALMAGNAPDGVVYTVNIPPEEITVGGVHVTGAIPLDEIGRHYREASCTNVRQIYANTRDWEPDFGPIDVVFIDGCHDADFVYNDTRKVLRRCRPGSLVMWHDFAPELAQVYSWVGDVCRGVERLYADGLIRGRILHLQDSWVGLYRVQATDNMGAT